MALMGGGGASAGTNSNSAIANLLGANSNTGSGFQLGGLGDGSGFGQGSMAGIPGMPYTENNVPGRPGFQMVPLGSIQHPLPGNAGEKHVSIGLFFETTFYPEAFDSIFNRFHCH